MNHLCVHIRLLAPSSLANTLKSLRHRDHSVICCGKSLLHVVGLKPVKDAKQFRLDLAIRDSQMSMLFVSRNYQSRPSAYLPHVLIVGRA